MSKHLKPVFTWAYRYVPEGQQEPDKWKRWAIDCYMHMNIGKSLPQYASFEKLSGEKYIPVRVATICQKGCLPDNVPSLVHKYCATCLSVDEAANLGLSKQRNFFANDIDELKAMVEQTYTHTWLAFLHCKTVEV